MSESATSNVTPEEVDAAFRSWLRDAPRPKPNQVDHYGYGWAMESFNAGYRTAEQRLLSERDRLLALVRELSEMGCEENLDLLCIWPNGCACLPCRARAELEGKGALPARRCCLCGNPAVAGTGVAVARWWCLKHLSVGLAGAEAELATVRLDAALSDDQEAATA